MIVVRKFLDNVFTKKELQVLDDILPAFKRHERQDDEEALQQTDNDAERRESASLRFTNSSVEVPMMNGKVMKIPHDLIKQPEINITEEMNKSGMGKSLEPQNGNDMKAKDGFKRRHGRRFRHFYKDLKGSETEAQKSKKEDG